MDNLISQMAEMIIEQNRANIGNDIANDAISRVKEEKANKKDNVGKGGTEDDVKETKRRKRTTRTA